MKDEDLVNKPNHYHGKLGLEVREVTKNFCEDPISGWHMQALQYLLRYNGKGGRQDLEKCKKCIEFMLELMDEGFN